MTAWTDWMRSWTLRTWVVAVALLIVVYLILWATGALGPLWSWWIAR